MAHSSRIRTDIDLAIPSTLILNASRTKRGGSVYGIRTALLLAVIMALCFLIKYATAEDGDLKLCFPIGETLTYKLKWGLLTVGEAELTSKWIERDGRRLIALSAKAMTGNIIAKIYPVEDHIESIVDPEDFRPIVYTQRLREGNHVRHDVTRFEYDKERAICVSHIDQTTKIIRINNNIRDVLSLLYYMRSKSFGAGQRVEFQVLVDDEIFELAVEGIDYDIIKVYNAGKIKCLRVRPHAKFGGIFSRGGTVQIWFSDDRRRICTAMKGKVPMAHMRASLRNVSGPGANTWPGPEIRFDNAEVNSDD
ncbi:MAG: DUF3108 domain-containing protein [Lentisphaerae bacterium]|nr:DUF3108 domain-containing protein [Lentisphaerota bacterium]